VIAKADLLYFAAVVVLAGLLAAVIIAAADPDLSRPCPTPTTITREAPPR
jgi:hypothetical protein